ncbi:hypothetical protein V8G54_026723 [Vigna mungo]|uniref:Uncharacterized protein n=1 Tax=Vigna mungo TaxID=3915 RepID=A0AAQ3RME7_VIGMU
MPILLLAFFTFLFFFLVPYLVSLFSVFPVQPNVDNSSRKQILLQQALPQEHPIISWYDLSVFKNCKRFLSPPFCVINFLFFFVLCHKFQHGPTFIFPLNQQQRLHRVFVGGGEVVFRGEAVVDRNHDELRGVGHYDTEVVKPPPW